MKCIVCHSRKEPWAILKNNGLHTNEDGHNIGQMIHLCSYSCNNQFKTCLKEKQWGELLINREDFCWIMPTIKKKDKKFEYLTVQEIQYMTEDQKENYYNERDNHLLLDNDMRDIYNELDNQDIQTMMIEEEESSESDYDDY